MESREEHTFDFETLVNQIIRTYENDSGINFIDAKNLPVRDRIIDMLGVFFELLFPGYTGNRKIEKDTIHFTVQELLIILRRELADQIERALMHQCRLKECPSCNCPKQAMRATEELLCRLPEIREMLKDDVRAAYQGDPAAGSFEEVVVSYPYMTAIAAQRIAHELYRMGIPLIPRIMTEWAHSQTGIDIHPGAKIGRSFFIDHGTGVVIGETAVIGDNVKIYQGVTLGALSFPRDERGQLIRDKKRHPTLEDEVTVYAEATILGDITIGKGAVIGGNVWIRESVPPGAVVTIAKPESMYVTRGRKKKTTEEKQHEPGTP